MSGKGAPELSVKNCGDLRVAVIAAQWHEKVMDGLLDGALRALGELGIDEPTVLRVPGSFELPVVAKVLAGRGYDAIVALGVVIRGGTPHFARAAPWAPSPSDTARVVPWTSRPAGPPGPSSAECPFPPVSAPRRVGSPGTCRHSDRHSNGVRGLPVTPHLDYPVAGAERCPAPPLPVRTHPAALAGSPATRGVTPSADGRIVL
ncbi:6,7-dimethyl-8-ribityllumazine synthase [Streptomyces antimycoticus]